MDLISLVFYQSKDVLSTRGQCTVGLDLATGPITLHMGEQL